MLIVALAAALLLAGWLRVRQWNAFLGIVLPAALVPLNIVFEAFIYPADPETRMWFHITIVTSTLYGLIAATIGYVGTAFLSRHRGA